MRWTIFNGSPRAKKSNSDVLVSKLREGLVVAGGQVEGPHYLVQARKRDEHLAAFAAAERVLVVFPLYVDAMPAQVVEFFAALADRVGRDDNPPMAFLVHSGFPEACHSRGVERYLEKLCKRLGSEYLGTMVKGGSEGIQVMPGWMTRKVFRTMAALGGDLGRDGAPSAANLRALAGEERLGAFKRVLLRLMKAVGLSDQYWKQQLRKNGVWERRYARPYEPTASAPPAGS